MILKPTKQAEMVFPSFGMLPWKNLPGQQQLSPLPAPTKLCQRPPQYNPTIHCKRQSQAKNSDSKMIPGHSPLTVSGPASAAEEGQGHTPSNGTRGPGWHRPPAPPTAPTALGRTQSRVTAGGFCAKIV